MQKPQFDASQFKPYRDMKGPEYTAEGKALFVRELADFVLADCPRKMWNKKLYNRLSGCFQHIAEYDGDGFFQVWFSTNAAKARWIKNALDSPCYGEPEYTHSDAEKAFRTWLKQSGLLEEYQGRLASEVERKELAELKRLQSKYGAAP